MNGTQPRSFGSLIAEHPLLVVVSGPSGVGKTAVVEALGKRREIRRSVSATTRARREGEIDGRDYHFLTDNQFRSRVERSGFAEWAEYQGCRYGTLRETIQSAFDAGDDIVLTIDVQGGAQIRARYREATLVFLMPPSFEMLEARLATRGTESPTRRARRIEEAVNEIRAAHIYDYVIVNEDGKIEETAANLDAILTVERRRMNAERATQFRLFQPGSPDSTKETTT